MNESYSVASCTSRTCGREIVWQRLEKKDGTLGKLAPYDYPPEPCPYCANSGAICGKCRGTGVVWVSHFATCSAAERFRRAKKAAG